MKPHIQQTIDDLKAERTKLDEIIQTLEVYGEATAPGEPLPVSDLKNNGHADKPRRKYKKREPAAVTGMPGTYHRKATTFETKARRKVQPQTSEQAKESVAAMLDAPVTFSGAMKAFCSAQIGQFTARKCFDDVAAAYPNLVEDYSISNAQVNLNYWAKQGYLERSADNNFKVLQRDWFKPTE